MIYFVICFPDVTLILGESSETFMKKTYYKAGARLKKHFLSNWLKHSQTHKNTLTRSVWQQTQAGILVKKETNTIQNLDSRMYIFKAF